MSDLSDETLMAFADDRLDEIQRGRVEEELARERAAGVPGARAAGAD